MPTEVLVPIRIWSEFVLTKGTGVDPLTYPPIKRIIRNCTVKSIRKKKVEVLGWRAVGKSRFVVLKVMFKGKSVEERIMEELNRANG